MLKGPGGFMEVGRNSWMWFSARTEDRVWLSRVAKWLMYFLAVSRRLDDMVLLVRDVKRG